MFSSVIEVHGGLFRRIGRIISLQAINRHFLAQTVEQGNIIAQQAVLIATGMSNNADGTSAMDHIDNLDDIGGDVSEPCLLKYIVQRFSIGNIAMCGEEIEKILLLAW